MTEKLLVLLLWSSALLAGPPMLTEDPFVPNKGQFEVNVAAFIEDRENPVLTAPIIDVNYGIIENVQLTLVAGYISTENERGWDAFEFAFKWNFYNGDFFSIAANPKYRDYPVETIFNEGETYEVALPMNFQFNTRWSLVFTPSYIYHALDDKHLELGAYMQYSLKQQNFYAELFTEESKEHDAIFSIVNLGYFWQFHNNVALLFSLGREIRVEEKEATIGFSGLQFLF